MSPITLTTQLRRHRGATTRPSSKWIALLPTLLLILAFLGVASQFMAMFRISRGVVVGGSSWYDRPISRRQTEDLSSSSAVSLLRPPPDYPSIEPPANWKPSYPEHCAGLPQPATQRTNATGHKLPRLVYYHMQHCAGTTLWDIARKNDECAPRVCSQEDRQCFHSYDEKVEAESIRSSPMTYISYEARLPRDFSLPFVSHEAREGLYFMTILRNPIGRLLTKLRTSKNFHKAFWHGFDDYGGDDIYYQDNLLVRWLAGVTSKRPVTQDDVALAKCRLDLFDLVLTEKTLFVGLKEVLCPMRNWENCGVASSPKKKTDPFESLVDPTYVGVWIERNKPSFELYDYARQLSVSKLRQLGVQGEVKDNLERPSYVDTLAKYANVTSNMTKHFPRLKRDPSPPPADFCKEFHRKWTSGGKGVPKVLGLKALWDPTKQRKNENK